MGHCTLRDICPAAAPKGTQALALSLPGAAAVEGGGCNAIYIDVDIGALEVTVKPLYITSTFFPNIAQGVSMSYHPVHGLYCTMHN